MTKSKKYIFVGQNASTGTPNAYTGKMSFFGTIYEIDAKSKSERDDIEMHFDRTNQGGLNVVGGRRRMREFSLGISVRNFNENLNATETVFVDDDNLINFY